MRTPFPLFVGCCLALFSCDSPERCYDRMSNAAWMSDSLFHSGDSAEWHAVAVDVMTNANCVLAKSTEEADRLGAKVAKDITEKRRSGWACQCHVRTLKEFHLSVQLHESDMTEGQWEDAMDTWDGLRGDLDRDHRAAYCVDHDVEQIEAMDQDFKRWRAESSFQDVLESAGEFIKDVFGL